MIQPKEFRLTTSHLRLLRKMNVGWQECEYGAPEINPKRPYGNSSVELDIAEEFGWSVDRDNGLTQDQSETASNLHRETQTALQIVLQFAGGPAPVGLYRRVDWRTWDRVGD